MQEYVRYLKIKNRHEEYKKLDVLVHEVDRFKKTKDFVCHLVRTKRHLTPNNLLYHFCRGNSIKSKLET